MTVLVQRIPRQFRLPLLALPFLLLILFLSLFLPPNGHEGSEWAQFIGRFHPLAVHFPIALMLLVPILELAGRNSRFSYLRLSAVFVLGITTLAATVAALLGWSLARSGGYSGPLLDQHMWGGISLAAVCWACWLLRARTGEVSIIYALVLATGVGLVAWTGYRGAQLSLGEDHLTEHMPDRLRESLGLSDLRAGSSSADPNTLYGGRIHPIFAARCFSCHGPNKHKGNLRLDSYRGLMKGGKDGSVIQAGNARGSDLFRRITLPADHDDFMPKESKRPLSPDQVKLIELWIGAGASDTLAVDVLKDARADTGAAATAEVMFEEIDPAAVSKARASIAPALAQLQRRFPNVVSFESRGSANLYVNASLLGKKFGDAELEAFSLLSGNITVADFSRTAITDRSVTAIAAMKKLRVLRLGNTAVTDAMVEGLARMSHRRGGDR
jgi:uncharacterized membrane protein